MIQKGEQNDIINARDQIDDVGGDDFVPEGIDNVMMYCVRQIEMVSR